MIRPIEESALTTSPARVRRQPEQPRAADRARLRPHGAARALGARRGARASTRSGSATASSPSRATRRWRCSRRSPSAPRGSSLGTACLVSSMRNPLYLALEWATLDVISGGRTILGTVHGQPRAGGAARVRGARAAVHATAPAIFEEGLEVLRRAVPHRHDELQGRVLQLRRRRVPLGHRDGAAACRCRSPPPIWIVSNPRLRRRQADREDARDHGARLRPHHPARRRLDDVLPRAASRGADRADRLPRKGRGSATAATSPTTRSPTRSR